MVVSANFVGNVQVGGPTASSGPAVSRQVGRLGLRHLVWRRLSWWWELASIATVYVIYEASRALSAPHVNRAMTHGRDVVAAERWLHMGIEAPLNRFLTAWDPLADAAGYYYSTLHFVVTPLVLVYLWRRHPEAYPRLRSALIMITGVALAVFILWPVAPPRFTDPALSDTLVRQHILGSNGHGVSSLINQYAAMPSLHVGWAVWCALAVVLSARSRWRHLAWLYPAATTFVVLATANHYLLDAVAGAALTLSVVFLVRPARPRLATISLLAEPVAVPVAVRREVRDEHAGVRETCTR
jgi:PAP2 superfamily